MRGKFSFAYARSDHDDIRFVGNDLPMKDMEAVCDLHL